MRRIIVACSSGLGTSLLIRLNLEALLREFGIEADVQHTDASSMYYHDADLIIGAKQIVESLQVPNGVEVVSLDDIVDRNYLREKMVKTNAFASWKN